MLEREKERFFEGAKEKGGLFVDDGCSVDYSLS
jgi:hypothetical protein